MEFILDIKPINRFVRFGKNTIKGPVAWAAEIIKDYPEYDQKILMRFEEIQNVVKTHSEFTITKGHVRMKDSKGKILKIEKPIGKINQLRADPKCRCGRGIAFININKIDDFLVNMLLRGGVLGISGGGFAEKLGPGGHLDGENFDASQQGVTFHHMALVTQGIPRCPTNICGFNLSDSSEIIEESALNQCTNNKIPYFKSEGMSQAQAVAASISYCKKKLGTKETFDFSKAGTPKSFKEYYEYLIFEKIIEKEPCVNKFYNEFKEAWKRLEGNGYINSELQIKDNVINLQKKELKKLTELEKLQKKIAALTAENKKLQDNQLSDATVKLDAQNKVIESLDKKNKLIEAQLLEAQRFESTIKNTEMQYMTDALLKSGKYTQDDISALKDYESVKKEFEVAKRFLPTLQDASVIMIPAQPQIPPRFQNPQAQNPQILEQVRQILFQNQQPQPPQFQGQQAPPYSVLPVPQQKPFFQPQPAAIPGNIVENTGKPVKQYRPLPAGAVPTAEELYDEKDPRWQEPNQSEADKKFGRA